MRLRRTGLKKEYDELEFRTYKPKNLSKRSNYFYKKRNFNNNNPRNSHHVVMKITGGAKNKEGIINHFDYITRNNQIALYDENNEVIDIKNAKEQMLGNFDKGNRREDGESRETYQMMFSAKGKNDEELIRQAVLETAKEEFDGYDFYIAVHTDTKNTHAHLVVSRTPKEGKKRLEIRKGKLMNIKRKYSKKLNSVGIESYFIEPKKNKKYLKFEEERAKKRELRKLGYEVVDYGKAPYKFKKGEKESYYLLLKTHNGKIKQHWSKGLEETLKNNEIKKGDRIKLKKIGTDEKTKQTEWSVIKTGKVEKTNGIEGWHSNFTPEKLEPYKLIDFGEAPYRFNSKMKNSAFAILEDKEGLKKEVWGKRIAGFFKRNGIKKGDKIKISNRRIVVENKKRKQLALKQEGSKSLKI